MHGDLGEVPFFTSYSIDPVALAIAGIGSLMLLADKEDHSPESGS